MPTFPEWWNWDLSFTGHAERMEQRTVTKSNCALRWHEQAAIGRTSWMVDS